MTSGRKKPGVTFWATVGALFVGVGVIAALTTHPSNFKMRPEAVHVDQETCDRILPGMTKADVETMIGGPDGWYGFSGGYRRSPNRPLKKGYSPTWTTRTGEIVIELDNNDRVKKANFYEVFDAR